MSRLFLGAIATASTFVSTYKFDGGAPSLGRKFMRKIILILVALAAAAGSASAADLPIMAPPPAPAPVYNWTGFYLFGGFGYGLWQADTQTVDPVAGICV